MRRSLLVSLLLLASAASAQDKKTPREADLGKKSATTVGQVARRRHLPQEGEAGRAPALQYDQFRLGVEVQVASKRREQIESLKKIIALSAGPEEPPTCCSAWASCTGKSRSSTTSRRTGRTTISSRR